MHLKPDGRSNSKGLSRSIESKSASPDHSRTPKKSPEVIWRTELSIHLRKTPRNHNPERNGVLI
jgi:hypothetical protein